MVLHYVIILSILSLAAIVSVKAQKLTVIGGLTGWVIGILVFAGSSYTGVAMIAVFFALGTAATSIGLETKIRIGAAEIDKGKRTAGQVIANAGVAAILAVLTWLFPQKSGLFQLMIAASLASATADTLSSELGNVYGSKFFNITSFKKDRRGADGVISAEGTLAGILGSGLIAIIFVCGYGRDVGLLPIVIAAGTIGNVADSVLGASLERKGYLNNNAVNFLNTLVAALSSLFLNYAI